jgi:steroid 5-alpha reductase family enzyme
MFDAFTMLGASFTLIMLLMIGLWSIYLFQRNAGIVDIGWGIGFLIAAWAYFFLGNGDLLKMIFITTMATLWAVRLTAHIFWRYKAHQEDPRYTRMRQKWGGDSNGLLFLMMFIFQGTLIVLISLPFFIVDFASDSEWTQWEFIGILVWVIGLIGEGFADAQLASFQKDPAHQGLVCKKGLWRFSRHPNYFFEFLIWVGFFLFALPAPGGIAALISPILILLLLLKVSGIPPTEEQSLETKGDLYRDYQRTTSSFIPWFPSS